MPFPGSKNDWTFQSPLGENKDFHGCESFMVRCLKKSPFLFSYWEEYFKLGLCEKEVLAASLGVGELSPPDCSPPSGPWEDWDYLHGQCFILNLWSTRLLKVMAPHASVLQTFLYRIKRNSLLFQEIFLQLYWFHSWDLRFCCCQLILWSDRDRS